MVPGASSLPQFFYKNKMNNNFERYVNFIVLLQFLSYHEIRCIRVPTLFLSGLADQLIQSQLMLELY